RHGLDTRVRIKAQAMATDRPETFGARHVREGVDFSTSREAARRAYEAAVVGPQDLDVVERHDGVSQDELITYEALGLCPVGGAEKFVLDGDNTYGGKVVTNPSGGLLSKGHPLGATGLAQCTELVEQLRGAAAARQVPGARLALQHNIGLGGAAVVTLYERVHRAPARAAPWPCAPTAVPPAAPFHRQERRASSSCRERIFVPSSRPLAL